MATAAELRRLREEQSIFAPLYEAARQQQSELAAQGRRPVFGGLLSKEPTYGTDTLRYEGIGNMLAGLLSPAAKAVDAPISAYRGTIPQEDMISEALGVGGLAMAGGGAVANAARPSGDGLLASNMPAINPKASKNLRERYDSALRFASGGKDSQKIKLTSDRISAAKEYLTREFNPELFSSKQDALDFKAEIAAPTQQMIDAQKFASAAVQRGEKVRFGMPDGKRGSLYVRVGDKGTVRFSDHAQPVEYDNAGNLIEVGGYSTKLGRRHGAASLSVDPQSGLSVEDAITSMLNANASKSAGLLTTAASEAQDMAKRILDLRAQGRASEVTDEMMAQADPQYMFANTPLPMDEASRMARAEAAGFDVSNPVFHGGASGIKTMDADVSEGKDFDTGVWTTSDRYNANRYAGSRAEGAPKINDQQNWSIYDDRGSVYPLLAKTSGYGETNFRGRNWGDAPEGAIIRGGGQPSQRISEVREDWRAWPYTSEAVRAARDTGRSGLVIKDVVDIGPNFPHKDHIGLGSEISDDVVAIDPSTLRSRFARFDPEFAHLSNLSAANVSPIGGLLAQSGANQQSGPVAPNLIDEYLKSLQARR